MGVQVLSYNFQVLGSSYAPTYLPTHIWESQLHMC